MTLELLKSLGGEQAAMLEKDGWRIEGLATASAKELMSYKGIGRVGASKIINEAAQIVNAQGIEVADRLAVERYYQKAPLAKILEDWENEGMPLTVVALSTMGALAALKGIDEDLALRLISKAQSIVNKRGLHQSKSSMPIGPVRQTSPAFDEKWLSGEVEPPDMSIRVRKNFERAQKEYKANK